MRTENNPGTFFETSSPGSETGTVCSKIHTTDCADLPREFSYETAFGRNIGWLTREEQTILKGKRVAIAGMGGVGGIHLLTLARLGIGAFNIADFDAFDQVNFNRQVGAGMSTIGKPKIEVMADMAADINPDLDLKLFSRGISRENIDEFLKDVDLFIDGLDFFAFDARELAHQRCADLGIPSTTIAPLGMGAALVNFLPGKTTFEQYFRLKGHSAREKAVRFLVGLSPAFLHQKYLVDPSAVDLAIKKGPSTPMACQLCAGVAGSEAVKILLKRGKVIAAPRAVQFDGYRNRIARTWRPFGNRNPIQKLVMMFVRLKLRKTGRKPVSVSRKNSETKTPERITKENKQRKAS